MVKIKDTTCILRLRLVRGLRQGTDVDALLFFRSVLVREGFDVYTRLRYCEVLMGEGFGAHVGVRFRSVLIWEGFCDEESNEER